MTKRNKITEVQCHFQRVTVSMEGRGPKHYLGDDAVVFINNKEIFLGSGANFRISWKKVLSLDLHREEGGFHLKAERHEVTAIVGNDRYWDRCYRLLEKVWNKRQAKEEERRVQEEEETRRRQAPSSRQPRKTYSKRHPLSFLAKNEHRNDWDSDGDDQIFNHTYQKPQKEALPVDGDDEEDEDAAAKDQWNADDDDEDDAEDQDAGEAVFGDDQEDGDVTMLQDSIAAASDDDDGQDDDNQVQPPLKEREEKDTASSRGRKRRFKPKKFKNDDDSDDDNLFDDPKLTTPNAARRIVSPATLQTNRLGFANDDDDDYETVEPQQDESSVQHSTKTKSAISSFFAPSNSHQARSVPSKALSPKHREEKGKGGVLGYKRQGDQDLGKKEQASGGFFAPRKKQKGDDEITDDIASDDETSTVILSQDSPEITDGIEKSVVNDIVSTPQKKKQPLGSENLYHNSVRRRADITKDDPIEDSPVKSDTQQPKRTPYHRKKLFLKSKAEMSLNLADERSKLDKSMSPSLKLTPSRKRNNYSKRYGGSAGQHTWRSTFSPVKSTQVVPTTDPDFRGIKNIGNTCYMNSSLQMLFSIPQFVKQINRTHGEERSLVSKLSGVFQQLAKPTAFGGASAKDLKTIIDERTDKFRGYQQRDANEFLGDLLDSVHEELLPTKKDDSSSDKGGSIEKEEVANANAETETAEEKKENCPVLPTDEFFRLDVEVCLKCKSCGYSRTKEEMYRYLSVDIVSTANAEGGQENIDTKEAKRTVDKCLNSFFEPEDREIKCEKCEDGNVATQTLKVLSQPKAILLHLKRFVLVEVPRKKLDDSNEPAGVDIAFRKNKAPVLINQKLSLHSFLKDTSEKEQSYSIQSIVHHIGSTANSGHYTADALRIRPNEPGKNMAWVSFDDTKVETAKSTEILSSLEKQKTAYMLLYMMNSN